MGPMIVLLFILAVVIAAVVFFIGYLLYTNGRNSGKTSAELEEKEGELIELYSSLEQMIKEIEIYTQKAKSEIYSDIERMKTLCGEITRHSHDTDEKKQYGEILCSRNENMDYVDKCRLVQEYHDKNKTIPEISRDMGLGQGEVKLILDLKNLS